MKEKDVNIDSLTEEFFFDNIKKNEILSKIQQIINSEDVNEISVLNKLVEKFEEKNKDLVSEKKNSLLKNDIIQKYDLLKKEIKSFKKRAYKKIDDNKKENLKKN